MSHQMKKTQQSNSKFKAMLISFDIKGIIRVLDEVHSESILLQKGF